MNFQQPLRILIADDVGLNLMLASESVKQYFENAEIAEVTNGKDVLELLIRHDFDLVLMDVHMDEMSGFEAAWHIRKHFKGQKQSIPIIALTGSDTPAEAEEALASGINFYLTKPVQPFELAKTIAEALNLDHGGLTVEKKQPAPSTPATELGLDLTFLRDFCDGDEKQMRFFLHKFLVQYPQELEKLTLALQNGDRNGIRLAIHGFWPQLVFVGMKHAADIADAIEQEIQADFREKELKNMLQSLKNDIDMRLAALEKGWL